MLHYGHPSLKMISADHKPQPMWLLCSVKNLTNMTFVSMQILKSVTAAIKLLTSTVLPFVPYAAQVWL